MEPDPMVRDTDPRASAELVRRFRAMTLAERAELTRRLCLDVERIARAGILADDPGASPREVARELARRRYGARLTDEAYAVNAHG